MGLMRKVEKKRLTQSVKMEKNRLKVIQVLWVGRNGLEW